MIATRIKKKPAISGTTKDVKKIKKWELRLYVAGMNAQSLTAFTNLKNICKEYLPDRYTIKVIDLRKNPQLGKGDQILAIPTLVRKLPEPIKSVIGDLSNIERVLVGLDIKKK